MGWHQTSVYTVSYTTSIRPHITNEHVILLYKISQLDLSVKLTPNEMLHCVVRAVSTVSEQAVKAYSI